MPAIRYAINVTLDWCYDHNAVSPSEELHHFWADRLAEADAMLVGRVTYQMMEGAWRDPAQTGVRPDWMEDWMMPFARSIHGVKKFVVSDTLQQPDWNAELIRGANLEQAVRQLKQQPGRRISLGGVTLPLALAKLGLIDEYEFVVHPRIMGHGPTLLAGLPHPLDLRLVDRREFRCGAVALLYENR